MVDLNERQVRILTEARGLVARGWTQGPYARDRDGKVTSVFSTEACSYCISGAILRSVDRRDGMGDRREIEEVLRRGDEHCIDYNEAPSRTQEEVLQLMDETLARYRK